MNAGLECKLHGNSGHWILNADNDLDLISLEVMPFFYCHFILIYQVDGRHGLGIFIIQRFVKVNTWLEGIGQS